MKHFTELVELLLDIEDLKRHGLTEEEILAYLEQYVDSYKLSEDEGEN